jgi:glycosyltransferase involved in cell wall biosynthesis
MHGIVSTEPPAEASGLRRESGPALSAGGGNAGDASRRRVALLTNEIPPYRVPLYRALAATPGWEFTVFTCVDREVGREWSVTEELGFSHVRSLSWSYLRREEHQGAVAFKDRVQVHIPVGLWFDLVRYRPDVIISLEMGARTLMAATYAWLNGRRLLVYFEGTPHTERDIPWSKRLLRRVLRRAPHLFTCNGVEGRRYLESLGVTPERIFEIGQAIDTELFLQRPGEAECAAVRDRWGVAGWCCLFSGQLIPRKGISNLLVAWDRFCRASGASATLLLAGDGPERQRLEQQAADLQLRNVKFVGFLQRHELPPLYHASDAFVFPTLHDCWALVVEEAMSAGLPVIDSKYNGSAVELIREGQNGWVADPLNPADLTDKLRRAWLARDRKESLGLLGRKIVAKMSVNEVAGRIRRAVEGEARTDEPGRSTAEAGSGAEHSEVERE